ncbi:hypothetical protein ABFX02_14G283100 [Erythranthe guttata]
MATSATSSCKALLSKIGCNRLLNPPRKGFSAQEISSNLQKRFPFATSTRTVFERWCKKYEKTYASEEEKEHRLKVFDKNREYVKRQHALGDRTVGLNGLADISIEEYKALYTRRTGCPNGALFVRNLGKGQVIHCPSFEVWREQLEKGANSRKLNHDLILKQTNEKKVVLDFTKSWFEPCRYIHPKFAKNANVIFIKMNLDGTYRKMNIAELGTIYKAFKADGLPSFMVLKEHATSVSLSLTFISRYSYKLLQLILKQSTNKRFALIFFLPLSAQICLYKQTFCPHLSLSPNLNFAYKNNPILFALVSLSPHIHLYKQTFWPHFLSFSLTSRTLTPCR